MKTLEHITSFVGAVVLAMSYWLTLAAIVAVGFVGAVVLATPNKAHAADPELIVFDWGGYDDPNFFGDYVTKHGDVPSYSFFSDEEEAFQKMRAGFKADLGHPCSQSVIKWREAGLLAPIDTSRLKNWPKVMEQFKSVEGFNVNGEQWVVPTDWGATALTYHPDYVKGADRNTLMSFIDPKFKDKVSIVDNVDDAYALGFLAVGVSDWNKATEEDFKKASAFLRKAHENVRTYWQDGAEARALMKSGEVVLSWSWNEVAVLLQGEGVPVVMNQDAIEGQSTWMCGYVLLKDAQGSKDKAYDFIDAWLAEESGAFLVNDWGYGHSNADVMRKHGEAAGFKSLAAYSKNTLWQSPVDSVLRERMIAEFELIKAGF